MVNINNIFLYLDNILDIIYPPKCMVCDSIIEINKPRYICDNCKNDIKFINKPTCNICGVHLDFDTFMCKSCKNKNFAFNRNISVFEYDNCAKRSYLSA